jgi:hypothetical protein
LILSETQAQIIVVSSLEGVLIENIIIEVFWGVWWQRVLRWVGRENLLIFFPVAHIQIIQLM